MATKPATKTSTPYVPERPVSLFGYPLLVIMATAFAALLPTFLLGIPSGHDFEFHLNSWMEVLGQWRLGILYPRWASLAHYGYGEARFIFYPPASWMLGAALGSILPWKIVPNAYAWIAMTLSGCFMFLLTRRFLDRRDSIFAAALYAANPYYMVIVYWRSAFAELLVGVLLPLLLLAILRLENGIEQKEDRNSILFLALIVAAAWLTNIPAAVMLTYSMALLLTVVAIQRHSVRPLIQGAAAVLFGLALAGFYIVPVLYEQNWVEIAQVMAPGLRPQDNFIFTSLNDPDHDHFNRLISLLSVAQIALLAIFCFISRPWRLRAPRLWWMLVAWFAACTLLLCSVSLPLYRFLPELRYVQLPLRWLLCLNVVFAALATLATKRRLTRALICLAMFGLLAFVWHKVQNPWWDDAGDVAEMQDHQLDGTGYEGIDEYVPSGGDVYEVKRDARRVTFDGKGNARLRISQWDPELKSFDANVSQPGNLVLRLFNYPAWNVEVNHRVVQTDLLELTGQMVIPVEAGDNQVRITFARTPDRKIGAWITGITIILMMSLFLFRHRRPPYDQSPYRHHQPGQAA